ncbi:MAG: hypothetical protein HY288_05365 [Planctomycetia bacterium]|nr:hypothetical protein [Planctomycetia bacterium]
MTNHPTTTQESVSVGILRNRRYIPHSASTAAEPNTKSQAIVQRANPSACGAPTAAPEINSYTFAPENSRR